MTYSLKTALIPYIVPKTPLEFIHSEIEKEFLHKVIGIHKISSSNVSIVKKIKNIQIFLPEKNALLAHSLFPLHRQIEREYSDLPWPNKIKKVVVFTDVQGGRGDVVAAAKAIAIMQRICPNLSFDWVLKNAEYDQYNPISFLSCSDPSKINCRPWRTSPAENVPVDFVLTGPTKYNQSKEYLEKLIRREIKGPVFNFLENAEDISSLLISDRDLGVKEFQEKDNRKIYQNRIHRMLFPNKSELGLWKLPMGIQPGSGVFLDKSRLEAPLSLDYCCPSYLYQIQDVELLRDILESLNVFGHQSQPDYDQYSFNSGYAHHPISWSKFIDCVAIHEKNKHVVIVLNQHGYRIQLSTEEFHDQILGFDHIEFLKRKGYGNIILKSQGREVYRLCQEENSRSLTVIIRPSFTPYNMKQIQLASERLLATGDNSAVEAWCARCKLYLYEDVNNGGCKWRFLQQQVNLAQTISPTLSKLLALFGGDSRILPFCNQPLDAKNREEMENLLNDPKLSASTIQFCQKITSNYSFEKVLEGAIKRTVWHYCIPELIKIEGENIDEEFQMRIVDYIKNKNTSGKALSVKKILEIGQKVHEMINDYLSV